MRLDSFDIALAVFTTPWSVIFSLKVEKNDWVVGFDGLFVTF